MLRTSTRYNPNDRHQLGPALFGAKLNIRNATPDDLPPYCLWVKAKTYEEAAIKIRKGIVEGEYSTAIWVPPNHGNYTLARKFFLSSVGELDHPSWDMNSAFETNRKMQNRIKRFASGKKDALVSEELKADSAFSEEFYQASRQQIADQTTAFTEVMQSRSARHTINSNLFYQSSGRAFYIHADHEHFQALRIITAWVGNSSFLYDQSQLTLMPRKSAKENFYIFRPIQEEITAWNPPPRAMIAFTRGTWDKPGMGIHSAQGLRYVETFPRVRGTLSLDVN